MSLQSLPVEIQAECAKHAGTATLIALGSTSRVLREICRREIGLGIRAGLREAIGGSAAVRALLDILETFHAVISGSLALKLALRHTEWMPGDVDIYVGADEYDLCVNAIAAAFNAVEVAMGTHNATTEAVHAGTGQAVPADAMLVEPSFSEGVDVVRRFQAPAVTFDIIKSNGDSFKPLASFHSTVVMNILTANRLIIGAPSFTLYGCGLQSYLYPNPKSLQALQKYERRGFAITYYATFEKGPGFGRALEIPLAGRMGNDGDEYDHLFDDMWERLRTL